MDHYKIIWTDSLLVGDELIDTQHKQLIELIGGIPEHSTPEDEVVLAEAMDYAIQHFSDELVYLKKIRYPEYERHKNEHKRLLRILRTYKKDYDAGEKDLYSFKQFMFQWIRDHIMGEDQKISLFLRSNS